ncbi:MAG: type II toxin-antitoxin system VapC family toxin [Syntrophorhabdaceae bacterium]|nr:type II toxin-antitoxin system VapC family toxin [Syntrophorhabdaceae bacterium]
MKLVLDTNIYVDFGQGRQEVVDLIATRGTEILLPVIVLGELFYGFQKGSKSKENEARFRRFVTSVGVSIIDVDEEVARKYSLVYSVLSAKGTPIPINDVWIAACCMSVGGTLLTRDRHFEQIEQIDKMILS